MARDTAEHTTDELKGTFSDEMARRTRERYGAFAGPNPLSPSGSVPKLTDSVPDRAFVVNDREQMTVQSLTSSPAPTRRQLAPSPTPKDVERWNLTTQVPPKASPMGSPTRLPRLQGASPPPFAPSNSPTATARDSPS